ncbi:hypothetical protein [Couchioplanes caeruleus]|uniref:Uncharacterized protein n=1 Tax=Couchioplanes caeruleus TaxID=56438 RepID=A0A3N1GM22_9ACTN|nr:hypothetical protein [Couchioplanes caeruleus]ROP31285.1 hypothetical protein EDD30_4180 [Couchioplanes caeruleus]
MRIFSNKWLAAAALAGIAGLVVTGYPANADTEHLTSLVED